MSFDFTIEDNSEKFLKETDDQVPFALEECGLVAEGYAKRLCPVDTGLLRNSIAHAVSGNTAYIGTNVEYGPYVELGTTRTRAQPFLKPAVTDHQDDYKGIIERRLKG